MNGTCLQFLIEERAQNLNHDCMVCSPDWGGGRL